MARQVPLVLRRPRRQPRLTPTPPTRPARPRAPTRTPGQNLTGVGNSYGTEPAPRVCAPNPDDRPPRRTPPTSPPPPPATSHRPRSPKPPTKKGGRNPPKNPRKTPPFSHHFTQIAHYFCPSQPPPIPSKLPTPAPLSATSRHIAPNHFFCLSTASFDFASLRSGRTEMDSCISRRMGMDSRFRGNDGVWASAGVMWEWESVG